MDKEYELIKKITRATRNADKISEQVGGGTRHWVSECLLPELEKEGLRIIQDDEGAVDANGIEQVGADLSNTKQIEELTAEKERRESVLDGVADLLVAQEVATKVLKQRIADLEKKTAFLDDQVDIWRKEAEEYKEYCESSIRANCLVQQKLREAYAAVAKLERVYEYEKRRDGE